MKITDNKLTLVHISLADPFVTALRRVDSAVALRVTLVCDDGRIGIGEAPPTAAITGETLDSIRRAIEDLLLPPLREPFADLGEALARLHAACDGHFSAKAAVDIALHDMLSPLTAPVTVETAVTVSLDTPAKMEAQARVFVQKGCRTLKVKLGARDSEDASRIRRIREAFPDIRILADANQAWNEAETLRFLDDMADCDIALLEQPLRADDLAGMARVTARSPIPILADESAFDLAGVRRVIETEAAHMVNVKLMKCGGIAKAREILQWCRDRAVVCMMGSMLETPASIRAAATLCDTFRDTVAYADLDSPLLWREIPDDAGIETKGCGLVVSPQERRVAPGEKVGR